MSAPVTTFEVPSPVGSLRCAATARGLALVAFPGSDFDGPLSRIVRDAEVHRGEHASGAELAAFFEGRRRKFTCDLDLSAVTPFARSVLDALRTVPFGSLITYGELARRAGRPGGARAVGQVMGANPVPIVVP